MTGEADQPDKFHRLLAEHWDDILAAVDVETAQRLVSLVAQSGDADPVSTRAEIEDLLLESLDGDHPIVRLLSGQLKLQADIGPGAGMRLRDMQHWLRERVDLPTPLPLWPPILPEDDVGEPPYWRELYERVRQRLLALPAYQEGQVSAHGVDVERLSLIRLIADDGTVWLPSFQFDGDVLAPRPEVVETNELLWADIDPWGAASWWVDPHAAIGAPPVELIGGERASWLPALAKRLRED